MDKMDSEGVHARPSSPPNNMTNTLSEQPFQRNCLDAALKGKSTSAIDGRRTTDDNEANLFCKELKNKRTPKLEPPY